jgi:hypothetical protein
MSTLIAASPAFTVADTHHARVHPPLRSVVEPTRGADSFSGLIVSVPHYMVLGPPRVQGTSGLWMDAEVDKPRETTLSRVGHFWKAQSVCALSLTVSVLAITAEGGLRWIDNTDPVLIEPAALQWHLAVNHCVFTVHNATAVPEKCAALTHKRWAWMPTVFLPEQVSAGWATHTRALRAPNVMYRHLSALPAKLVVASTMQHIVCALDFPGGVSLAQPTVQQSFTANGFLVCPARVCATLQSGGGAAHAHDVRVVQEMGTWASAMKAPPGARPADIILAAHNTLPGLVVLAVRQAQPQGYVAAWALTHGGDEGHGHRCAWEPIAAPGVRSRMWRWWPYILKRVHDAHAARDAAQRVMYLVGACGSAKPGFVHTAHHEALARAGAAPTEESHHMDSSEVDPVHVHREAYLLAAPAVHDAAPLAVLPSLPVESSAGLTALDFITPRAVIVLRRVA